MTDGLSDGVVGATYRCPTCLGTGQIESSDSTDDRWWSCECCEGTGCLKDRRHPLPAGLYHSDGKGKVVPTETLTSEEARALANFVDRYIGGVPGSWEAEVEAKLRRIAALSATDTDRGPGR